MLILILVVILALKKLPDKEKFRSSICWAVLCNSSNSICFSSAAISPTDRSVVAEYGDMFSADVLNLGVDEASMLFRSCSR